MTLTPRSDVKGLPSPKQAGTSVELKASELAAMLLEGIDLTSIQRRKRFELKP